MPEKNNNTGWKVATILMSFVVLLAGGLLKMNSDRMDVNTQLISDLKIELKAEIEKNRLLLESQSETSLQLMIVNGQLDVRVAVLTERINHLASKIEASP